MREKETEREREGETISVAHFSVKVILPRFY